MDILSLSWSKTREKINSENSELLSLLDSVASKNRFLKVYDAGFSYGDTILKEGKANIPAMEKEQRFAFGLVVSGSFELFIQKQERPAKILTLAMLKPGNLVFLQNSIQPFIFPFDKQSITAGARSIFLLPKIGNSDRYWRMARRNNIPLDMPGTLLDQWNTFTALAKSLQSDWCASLLLFSENWLQQKNSGPLREYLQKREANDNQLYASKPQFDDLINTLTVKRKDIHSKQVLKNLLAIASGALPGFVIAEDENFAPIKMIQRAFINDYGLEYADIMHPDYLHSGTECFYSPDFLNDLNQNLSLDDGYSGLNIIKDTKRLHDRFIRYHKVEVKEPSTVLNKYFQARFEFFHTFGNQHNPIKQEISKNMTPQCLFSFMPFMRKGCIAISQDQH